MISIHSLRGEGDLSNKKGAEALTAISIHSLRGEGDLMVGITDGAKRGFQSTPSVGRETVRHAETPLTEKISIHSLRGEGDPNR